MYHYLYKITNDFDNCFYYGVHSTKNLEDNYMGSGLRLGNAYRAHGIEHFSKEILEFFETREALLLREKEVVTIELVKDPNCYNLVLGGGNCEPTGCVTARFKGTEKGLTIPCEEYGENKALYETIGTGKVACKERETGKIVYILKEEFENNRHLYKHFAEGMILAIDSNGKYFLADVDDSRFKTGEIKNYGTGKQHSEETISKMKETHAKNQHQQGSRNSNYGMCGITNGLETKSIKKEELQSGLDKGGHQGRMYKDTSKMAKSNQNRIGINKNNEVKMIQKSEAKKYKDEGGSYGRNVTRSKIKKKSNLNFEFGNNL